MYLNPPPALSQEAGRPQSLKPSKFIELLELPFQKDIVDTRSGFKSQLFNSQGSDHWDIFIQANLLVGTTLYDWKWPGVIVLKIRSQHISYRETGRTITQAILSTYSNIHPYILPYRSVNSMTETWLMNEFIVPLFPISARHITVGDIFGRWHSSDWLELSLFFWLTISDPNLNSGTNSPPTY